MANNMLDTNTLAQLHNNYLTAQKQAQKPQTTQKKGNIFTNLLPAIGGGVGAIAGIPLDIFGGAGSIAGGAVGSSLGEALKEKLTGQNLSAKQIGIQGLEGGALSAFNPLKIVGKASTVAKGFVNGGTDVAKQAADKAAMQGVDSGANRLAAQLQKTGQGLKAEGTGIKAGATAPGSSVPLRPSGADKLQQYLDTVPGAKNSAHTQMRAVEADVNNSGKQIESLVAANDGIIKPQELQAIHASGDTVASKALGLDKNSQLITDTKNQINGAIGSLSKMREVRSNVDDTLKNFYKQTDRNSATTAEMKVLKGYRDGIDKVLSDRVPGFKDVNTRYANGLKAMDYLGKNANPSGLKLFGIQTHVGGEGLQAGKDALGRAFVKGGQKLAGESTAQGVERAVPQVAEQTAGNVVPQAGSGVGSVLQAQAPGDLETALQGASDAAGQIGNEAPQGLPSTSRAAQALKTLKGVGTFPARAAAAPLAYPGKTIAQVGKQELGRVGGSVLGNVGATQQNQSQSTNLTDALMSAGGQQDQSQPQSQSPYSQEDLQYDLQRDPANASKYIDYYNSLDKIYSTSGTTAANKPSAQQYGLAQSGLSSLQQLASMIQSNPDIVSKNATPGQGIPLVGSLISNAAGASGYHSLADNVLQAIIHLQTGATATKEETTAARGQLPQPGDSKAVKQQKLQTLLSDFAPFLGAQ